jgi:subtilisin family serine protease
MRQSLARAAPIAALLVLVGCVSVDPHVPLAGPAAEAAEVPKQLRLRQIIVTLSDDTPERLTVVAQALASEYRLQQSGSFPLRSIRVQCLVFQVPPERSIADLIAALRADSRVESVQQNQIFVGSQEKEGDSHARLSYAARMIGVDAARRTSKGKGIRVAVVDTGVDQDHPKLRGRIATAQNFVDGGERDFARDRHGTAVVGVIAARADDESGFSGIAPEAEVIAAKACWYAVRARGKASCSSWTLAKAIDFSINMDARVLNLSLAGPPDPLLARLIARAHNQGVTIVAASAESGDGPGFPASLPSVIAVVASDAGGRIAQRLPGGSRPAVAAPGIDILTTAPRATYELVSGSSFAAAHVTGVVALLLEQTPELRPADASELLQATAHPIQGVAPSRVAGVVDACAALGKLLRRPSCP